MATVSFVSTSSDKLNKLAVKNGQMIFVQDERAIYMDNNGVRTSYQQIITLNTEAARTSLAYPLRGFYFIKETLQLWEYDSGWTQITQTPKQQIVFDSYANFPHPGDPEVIYIDETNMYRYINGQYQRMNSSSGGSIWVEI